MTRGQTLRIAMLLAPPLCLVLGGYVAVSQHSRLRTLEETKVRTEQNLQFVKRTIAQIEAQPSISKVSTVPESADEQSLFLDMLRVLAAQAEVELVRWTNAPLTPDGRDPNLNPDGTPKTEVLTSRPIVSTIELRGTFANLRTFLYSVTRAYRLLNISKVRWERSESQSMTRITFNLTRFVSPTEASVATLPEVVRP